MKKAKDVEIVKASEGKVLAYIRVSTMKQDVDNQRFEILGYAQKHELLIDEFIEVELSSRRSEKERRIDELREKLGQDSILICSELSRLGRSTVEVLSLINELLKLKVRIIIIKQGMDLKGSHDMQSKVMITLFSLFGELERDLISIRTKEALACKRKNGIILGKPRGTIQKSKFDRDIDKIRELLEYGLSVRKIGKVLGYSNHIGLNTYLNKRGLKAKC